ncbi:MAG: radical SAM protein [bacterium]|nr:radical SAM protein [bacterium]
MKYTFLVTQKCNLSCQYCYIKQRSNRMTRQIAKRAVDFSFRNTPPDEPVEVGFFGGEPLLEFGTVKEITNLFEDHPEFDSQRVRMTVITNGTVFSKEIATFLGAHNIALGISCDGPPEVHGANRRFRNGRTSAQRVEHTITLARRWLPTVMVNAVYGPQTAPALPRTVDYLSSLGIRQIYLTPDFCASWSPAEIEALQGIFDIIGQQYAQHYLEGDPHFLSPIDSKIAVMLRGGYDPTERCRMGRGEFAFTPEGSIYPCERLVGDGKNEHSIGNLDDGIQIDKLLGHCVPAESLNKECASCRAREFCMNWCGCSNFFTTGFYNRVSPLQCALEKATLNTALEVLQTLESKLGPVFCEHLSGVPQTNSMLCRGGNVP